MSEIPNSTNVRAQVERILSHPQFAAAARLCGFLRFVVDEQLAGRGSEIKEYAIGVSVYQKSEAYDPRTDPTVRVDARKLRTRLSEYYESAGRDDAIRISIPKGTYVPCIEQRGPGSAVGDGGALRPPRHWVRSTILGTALGLAIVCAGWGARRMLHNAAAAEQPANIMTLTSYPGEANHPSLSPDGSMVAFSWNGEAQDNFDIYVKVVDGPNALRLTTDAARDVTPAWSPDGRQIAFLRNPGASGEVYVVSALGGAEKRMTASAGKSVGWTGDSKGLLVIDQLAHAGPYAGFVVSIETGERKQITFPPLGSYSGDYDLVASPDGKRIAFCRMQRVPLAELWVMPAEEGRAEKITGSRNYLGGLAWTPDGQSIVFSSQQSGFPALWKVEAAPSATPRLMQGLETDAIRPSIPLRPDGLDRIAYQHREQPFRLWHASLAGGKMSEAQAIVPSQRNDVLPQISPDGERIAFASNRTGNYDIFVCGLDGRGLRNLTAGSGLIAGAPRWSPDRAAIAFDARDSSENRDIYRVPAAGGRVQRVTQEVSEEARPSWSADGRWIYFTSDRSGRREVWKTPVAGGNRVQVTTGGGFEPFESADGACLYYFKEPDSRTLWRTPSAGGTESPVLEGVRQGLWSVTDAGIYFVDSSLRVCRLEAGGKVTCVGKIDRLEEFGFRGLSVSRNGREMVYVQPEPARSDLRMAEGRLFR